MRSLKLLPQVSLGARARRRGVRRFFRGRFLRCKNRDSKASRTGPYLKEDVRKINDFIVFLSIQGVNSTVREKERSPNPTMQHEKKHEKS